MKLISAENLQGTHYKVWASNWGVRSDWVKKKASTNKVYVVIFIQHLITKFEYI